MDLELNGKRALVTGGSRGIGKAIARVLAQEGVDVALLARDPQTLATAAAELSAVTGRRVIGVRADTTADESLRRAISDAARQLGGAFDILVNAAAEPAGFAGPPKLTEITGEYFHAEMDTKVMGYIRCAREVCRACAPPVGAASSTSAVWVRARPATRWAACATSRWQR